jgi:acetyltransferase-like isoleucine patch superfamily enzyme
MATVGKHCVIGAGSVVTKPIPDYSIAAGVPAQVIRSRQTEQAEGPASAGPRSRAG